MKKQILALFFILFALNTFAQNKVRHDYNLMVVLSPTNPDLKIRTKSHNIFIENYKGHGDLLHITVKGIRIVYVRTTKDRFAKLDDGTPVTYFNALDEKGKAVTVSILEGVNNGIIISSGLEEGDEVVDMYFINVE